MPRHDHDNRRAALPIAILGVPILGMFLSLPFLIRPEILSHEPAPPFVRNSPRGTGAGLAGSTPGTNWLERSQSIGAYREENPGRPVLVLFAADWDLSGALLKVTFDHPSVRATLKRFRVVMVYADLSNPRAAAWAELEKTNGITCPHTVLFLPGFDRPEAIPYASDSVTLLKHLHSVLDTPEIRARTALADLLFGGA